LVFQSGVNALVPLLAGWMYTVSGPQGLVIASAAVFAMLLVGALFSLNDDKRKVHVD